VAAFGNTRTPLDQIIDNERLVVAGDRLFRIPSSATFHDFLITYGLNRFGIGDFRQSEHPLAKTLRDGFAAIGPRLLLGGPITDPNLGAFLSSAYDLFSVADNAKIQDSLIRRMQDHNQYQGARYELFVAASLLRAGFKIEFEDETDNRNSHCEFTAIAIVTKKTFSV
jgi:hypothetical protein